MQAPGVPIKEFSKAYYKKIKVPLNNSFNLDL